MLRRFLGNVIRRLSGMPPWLGITTPAREQMLYTALAYLEANKIGGSYGEFGVWLGSTFATAFRFSCRRSHFNDMRFYAFDSFEGFPKLSAHDIHPMFKTGGRAVGQDAFEKRIFGLGMPRDRVKIYPGWFAKSLAAGSAADRDIPDQSLAMVWADGDLYESTRDLLPFIARKIKPGGVIAFDNWYCFDGHPAKGEQRALYEFLGGHSDLILVSFFQFGWHGQSFIWHTDKPTVWSEFRAGQARIW
jgi:O-methyltransferase